MRTKRLRPDDPAFARMTVAVVALEFGQPTLALDTPSSLANGRGTKQLVFARQVSMYLLQTVFDMTMTRVAFLFGRDRSTVSHALNVVEDSRDDPVFNAKLEKMEDFLIGAQATLGIDR